jgi:dihydroorotate dehydrogenase electron transfer subunit
MTRIAAIHAETHKVSTFEFADAIDAQPGQFIMLWIPGVDEKPMSIAGMSPLTISAANVGPATAALHALKPGDWVGWRGPFGRPFALEPGRHAVLVAGGYGSAPLYALAQQAIARGIETTVVIGAREARDLLYAEKFAALGVRTRLATNDGSRGTRGFVTDAINAEPALNRDDVTVYACGPEMMLVALHALAHTRGWHAQLSVERYMKCGFGICGQCALDDQLVCVDGPVMTLAQLDGREDFGHWHRIATGEKVAIGVSAAAR